MKNKKTIAIVLLVVALLGLAVAFAALSTTLTINGSGLVDPDSWSIKFANLSTADVEGSAVVTSPAELTNDTSITGYNVTLKAPGDSVTYTFDVVNEGDIDAILTSLLKPAPTCTGKAADDAQKTADATLVANNLVYTLVYTDTKAAVAKDDTLDAGQTRNLTLTIGYSSAATELPSDEVQLSNMNIDFVYGQN